MTAHASKRPAKLKGGKDRLNGKIEIKKACLSCARSEGTGEQTY